MKKKSFIVEIKRPKLPSNHTEGVTSKPGYYTDPSTSNPGKVCFSSWVGKGESPMAPDVNVVTVNGTFHSKGQGNPQFNWGNNLSGEWNNNDGEWEGANRSGNS